MKKVLALVVAFALCFTVFAGCFATSAAAVADSFIVEGSTAEATGGAATVTVSGAYDAKTVQLLTVTLPEGVTFVSVDGMTQLTADGDDGDYVVNGQVIKFLTIANSTFEIVINVTVPANETAEDVTYNVAAAVEFAAFDDTAVSTDEANGNITVKAEVPQGPVLDENIVFNGEGASITETLDIRLRVTKALLADYASYEVVVNPTVYASGNETAGEEVVLPLNSGTTKNFQVYYKDLSMFMLNLPIEAYVKCYDAEGNFVAYSNTFTYIPADLVKAQYTEVSVDAATDTQKKLNAIVTDILNMSAKAQVYFGTQAQQAGSQLAALVEAGNLVNKGWPQDFATTSDLSTLDATYSLTHGEGFDATNNPITFAADLSGAPVVTFKFSKATTAYPDTSKLKLDLSYTSVKLGEKTSTVEGDAWAGYKVGKSYTVPAKLVAMYDGNKAITGTLTYDGNVVATFSYSLESYIKANKDTEGAMGELLTAFGIFNTSARAYFGTN